MAELIKDHPFADTNERAASICKIQISPRKEGYITHLLSGGRIVDVVVAKTYQEVEDAAFLWVGDIHITSTEH